MAHHLAALIVAAETASGDAKAATETQAADLIMRLWERRRDLHVAADPLGPCRAAVELLSRLRAESNPWVHHRGHGGSEELLADLFDNMARIVVGGILLTQGSKLREIAPIERTALSPEEIALCEQLAWWEGAIAPDIPKHLLHGYRIRFVAAAEASSREDSGQNTSPDLVNAAPESRDVPDKAPLSAGEARDEFLGEFEEVPLKTPRSKEQVTEALEHLQSELARLVEAWKAGPGQN